MKDGLPPSYHGRAPRKKETATQYNPCYRFHHSQCNCHAQLMCVKCVGSHAMQVCKKTQHVAAKYANCRDAHTASYRGCLRFSRVYLGKKTPRRTQPKNRAPVSAEAPTKQPTPVTGPARQPVEAATKASKRFMDAAEVRGPNPLTGHPKQTSRDRKSHQSSAT
jgi:hypothetical protein